MKNEEELDSIREESEQPARRAEALSDDELDAVTGGAFDLPEAVRALFMKLVAKKPAPEPEDLRLEEPGGVRSPSTLIGKGTYPGSKTQL